MNLSKRFSQIESLIEEIHYNNKQKGFWDNPVTGEYDTNRNIGEMLMLVTSELSEGLEADRLGRRSNLEKFYEDWYQSDEYQSNEFTNEKKTEKFKSVFIENIKDSFEDELADAVIRIFDMCGGLKINLDAHIKFKLMYNKTREHKHGKKY